MCTSINQDDFVTVHHEMGHIAYYQQYKEQPFAYREAPNPGTGNLKKTQFSKNDL